MEKTVKIGIDLGTVNLLIQIDKKGIVFNQPSVIAYNVETNQVLEIGQKANDMTGTTNKNVRVIRPLRGGVISDMRAARDLLKYALQEINDEYTYAEECIICCPSEVTNIEMNSLIDVCRMMGINNVRVEEEILTGALGSGLDISKNDAQMIIDIGGGTTDIGIICGNKTNFSKSVKVAGNYLDAEIYKMCRSQHNVEFGFKICEDIKINLLSADFKFNKEKKYTGRCVKTGVAKEVTISSTDLRNITDFFVSTICDEINEVLANCTPSMCADIANGSLLFNGGGALIDKITHRITEITGLSAYVSDNPLESVVLGTSKLFI